MKIGDFTEARELTPEEIAEYRKLQPGIYKTDDVIRAVTIADGIMEVLEITQDMMAVKIRVTME